jgi:hypothetical protein
MLMGGNAVISRAILKRVGLYNTALGRRPNRLLSGEDDDMYQKLLRSGARGLYLPDLIIYHYVPPERLTKSYFRSWSFWRGVSAGLIDRDRRMPVAYLFGVPRYLYGQAARGIFEATAGILGRAKAPGSAFDGELVARDVLGYFYGKHLYGRMSALAPLKARREDQRSRRVSLRSTSPQASSQSSD